MFWLFYLACSGPAASTHCDDLCAVLVVDCSYAAFPDKESCLEGCAYNEKEGADIESQLSCTQEAVSKNTCDTFTVLECEHAAFSGTSE